MTRASILGRATAAFPPSLRWWLKDPLVPSVNMQISMQPGTFSSTATDPQQIVFPIGNPQAIIMRDTIKMPSLQLPLVFLNDPEYQAFEALRATGHVLLLQAPQELGQWYILLGPSKQDQIVLATMRAWSTEGLLVRNVTVTAQTVGAP